MTLRINDLLIGMFRGIGIKLVDFKIEYGKTWNKGKVVIGIMMVSITKEKARGIGILRGVDLI